MRPMNSKFSIMSKSSLTLKIECGILRVSGLSGRARELLPMNNTIDQMFSDRRSVAMLQCLKFVWATAAAGRAFKRVAPWQ